MGRKESRDVHPGLGGDLNLGPSECQPSVTTTTPLVVYLRIKIYSIHKYTTPFHIRFYGELYWL